MRRLVNAVLAEDGGALSNLLEIYKMAREDESDEWFFITSKVKLEGSKHITVFSYPILKKNWLFRLIFDYVYYPAILNKYAPDYIYNYSFYRKSRKCKGIYRYYATNALFFTEKTFRFRESKNLWARQKLLRPLAYKAIKDADEIVVESEWMKNSIVETLRIKPEKIIVKKHSVIGFQPLKEGEYDKSTFLFYPTSAYIYKNIDVIIESLEILSKKQLFPAVVFTLEGNENLHILNLKEKCERLHLNVYWLGRFDRNQMRAAYLRSILLFPSYLETVGLPLIEARYFHRSIICADLQYSRCALEDYDKVVYFKFDDALMLSSVIEIMLNKQELQLSFDKNCLILEGET